MEYVFEKVGHVMYLSLVLTVFTITTNAWKSVYTLNISLTLTGARFIFLKTKEVKNVTRQNDDELDLRIN